MVMGVFLFWDLIRNGGFFFLLSYYITFTDDVERDLNKIMLMDVCI